MNEPDRYHNLESHEIDLTELRTSARAKDKVLAAIFDRQTALVGRVDQIEEDTSMMRRALHGDPPNKVPGVIDLTHRNHDRLKALEKYVAYGSGGIVVIGLFWDQIKARMFGK